jgi:enoyl-CoA hydratase/carnithine racemase
VETLRLDRDGPVGWLRLNRPEKLNSFTIQMWRELAELGDKLSDDDELRALVVTGEGRAFSSGIDTSVFTSSDRDDAIGDETASRHDDPVVAAVLRTQDAYTWLEEAPFATIAAVRGYALGAGLQLALACDVRIVSEETKLGLLELKYGILPDLGGTQRLPRLVGPGKAKELIFTGAQIDAAEALRIGLAERVVADADLDREAGELAARIAAQPPLAVRGVKRAVDAAATLSVRDGLLVEAEAQAVCLQSDDMREAITAFVEQRPPRYHAR